jgi:hypothetical protein
MQPYAILISKTSRDDDDVDKFVPEVSIIRTGDQEFSHFAQFLEKPRDGGERRPVPANELDLFVNGVLKGVESLPHQLGPLAHGLQSSVPSGAGIRLHGVVSSAM